MRRVSVDLAYGTVLGIKPQRTTAVPPEPQTMRIILQDPDDPSSLQIQT
ncbi:MAG TPA: hypothetical protein P5525_20625 [Candidatus Paceibacterota bacterium]|nr:hypothetical protein [Candidatus Paceibacterota bacterium]